jgi:hypothetical protein
VTSSSRQIRGSITSAGLMILGSTMIIMVMTTSL